MNNLDAISQSTGEQSEHSNSSQPRYLGPLKVGHDDRLAELEIENSRLHRLVAELLIKNEQLRKTD